MIVFLPDDSNWYKSHNLILKSQELTIVVYMTMQQWEIILSQIMRELKSGRIGEFHPSNLAFHSYAIVNCFNINKVKNLMNLY